MSRSEEAQMRDLLAAIYGAIRTRSFTVRSLRATAGFDDLSTSLALGAALAGVGGGDPHRLGHALKRAEGVDFGGLSVVSCGTCAEGMLRVIVITRHERHIGG